MSSPEAQKEAQKLADLVRSPFAAQLVAAMPEPAVIVSSDERAAAANKPALDLLPGLRVRRSARARLTRARRHRRAPPGDGERRSRDGAVERARAGRTAVRRHCRAARDGRGRSRGDARSPCAIRPKRGASSVCASISSPTPATSCARRSPRWLASSRPCRDLPTMTRRRATGSSPSCASRAGAWPD